MKNYIHLITISFFLLTVNAIGQNTEIWNTILSSSVSEKGAVDYRAIQKQKDQLNTYLSSIKQNPPKESWSVAMKTAYWINTYNAFTVQLIIMNYPIQSIMKIEGGKAWDLKFIEIGGEMYSLNNIEHDILRKKYFDPRLHFVLNCAAKSCPRLYNRAITENNIEAVMQKLTVEFINDSQKNYLSTNSIMISQLFNWYKDDFNKKGTTVDFLNIYSKQKINQEAKISFKEYDWSLNVKDY